MRGREQHSRGLGNTGPEEAGINAVPAIGRALVSAFLLLREEQETIETV